MYTSLQTSPLPKQEPYPLHAFPLVVHAAALDVLESTKAPPALVGMEFLTNMSATAQGLFDVRLPIGKISPVSLNLLIVAESGERMSAVHRIVGTPMYKFDDQQREAYEESLRLYEQEVRVWKVTEKALTRKLSKAVKDDADVESVQQELCDWARAKPVKPRARQLMRQNISERAMMDALEGSGESVAFIGDEGEVIIKGGALDKTGFLNKAWDGAESLKMDRANGVSVVAHQPRVTVAFKAQPEVLQELMKRRGVIMRGSGHWARYLVGNPPSTQGTRQSHGFAQCSTRLAPFHARMQELLDEFGERMQTSEVERQVLDFAPEAHWRWQLMANEIEGLIGPGGYLADVKDFASKIMEITSRVAALLHIYGGAGDQISVDSLEQAGLIVEWHCHEFKRLFSPACQPSQADEDARLLGDFLSQYRAQGGSHMLLRRDLRLIGPVGISRRFDEALRVLISAGCVRLVRDSKRQEFVELNSQVFPAAPVFVTSMINA